jgi:MarR family transcriptional regulator, organic hydroperoxide resistance regulator
MKSKNMAAARVRPSPHRDTRNVPARGDIPYRLTDYPLHYFAAIQLQNQLNLARTLRDIGVSVPMWRALAALQLKDNQTIGEIAQLAVVDRSSLGRLLETMAKDGLVEREPLADDRRAVSIRLSSAGKKLFEKARPLVLHHYDRLLKGIQGQDLDVLMRVLRRIKANARMMADVADVEPQ